MIILNINILILIKLSLLIFTALSINASYASDSGDIVEMGIEKARVKIEGDGEVVKDSIPRPLPSAGQLIFYSSPLPVAPTTTSIVENEISAQTKTIDNSSKPDKTDKKPTSTNASDKNTKKDKYTTEDDTEVDPKIKKNEKKKPSNETTTDNSDDPPKRLFRPRFRAESSAQTLKFPILTLITLSITVILIIFI